MFTINLADRNFTIYNRYSYIEKLCVDYIVPSTSDAIEIRVSDADIQRERDQDVNYKDAYLETLAIYRKICEILVNDGIILFHSSAIMMDGQGILFAAPSGTGKSTHAALWEQVFGDKVTYINDDKPLIRLPEPGSGDAPVVYGTPWCGKEYKQTNTKAPVKAIVILERGEVNEIEEISFVEAYPMLMNQTYRPMDTKLMRQTISMVSALDRSVKLYRLKCNISEDAARTAFSGVFGIDL